METFSALLAICAGNSPVSGEFPAQRPVTRSFDVFLDLRLNKRMSKQSRGRWFDTPSRPLWHHCNAKHSHGFVVLCFVGLINGFAKFICRICPHYGGLLHSHWGTRMIVSASLQWRHNEHDFILYQFTSLTIVCSNVYSGGDQRKHQSSSSLAFVRGIHRWPVNSPHKGPVTRKMFPFDDVSMW